MYAAIDEAIHRGTAHRTVPRLCREALREVTDGHRRLGAVRHPLGFICLPVERTGELGVCIHLWSPAVPPITNTISAIHSHSWDMVSFVLYGRVVNIVTRVVDDALRGNQRIFEIHSKDDVDEIRPTPRLVRCVDRVRQVTGPGRSYRLSAGQFHESDIEGSVAATVVLGRTRAAVDLSVGPLDTPTHRLVRQRCAADETATWARMVDGLLSVRGG